MQQRIIEPQGYGIAEARDYLGIRSDQTIRRMVWSGQLKSYKVGNRRMILKSELDRFIQEQITTEEE